MRVRDQQNFATGILYLAVGVAVAVAASHYRIGSLGRMGPGYFPFAAGMALGLVGFCLMALALGPGAPTSRIGTWSSKSALIVFSSIVFFGLLIEQMGLVVAVPVLVGLSSRAHPNFSWRSLGLSLLVLLLVTWAIFVLLLGLPFPMLPLFLTK